MKRFRFGFRSRGETQNEIASQRRRNIAFEVLELSYELIENLRDPWRVLRTKDPSLAKQLRDAANSIPSNLAEERRRTGKDKIHFWRIAAGSADEVQSHLREAKAWGDVKDSLLEVPLELVDRILAMTWKLTN